ncbi:MAG: cyclic nucleotide-binding domain-containing protein [Elusimicrobia bacterium]|nr:cyclic nucleotide-binding domain-containing protein [Elusimicrobiota bacterium]
MERITISGPDIGALAKMMQKVDLFSPLTVGQLEKVLPHVMLGSYAAGETVFRRGDAGDAFYIVYAGKVEIRLKRMLFLSKTVASLGEGAFFGEGALLSQETRNASVVCVEPTRLFTLLAADFQFILHENPAAAEEMRSIAAQRKFVSTHAQ